jgi:hypothetical protein
MEPSKTGTGHLDPAISYPFLHCIEAYYSTLKWRAGGTSIIRLAIIHDILSPVYIISILVD